MAQNLRLQVMLNAVDRVTGPLKRMREGAGKTARAMRETRDRLKTLQATQKDISSFRTLKNQSEATGRAMREQQERIRRLSRQMQSNQGDTAALANERRKAILQARQLSQRYDSERQKLQRLRTSLNNSGISTHNLSQDQQRLANEIKQTNQKMEAQKQKLKQLADQQRRAAQASDRYQNSMSRVARAQGVGMGMFGTGLAQGYAASRLLTPGVAWGEQMSTLQAVGRFGADDERYQALRQQSRELGGSTAFSATEVGGGQEFLLRAGMSAEAIQSSMRDVLNLALANNTELARAADIASNIAGTFKIDMEAEGAMARVGDILSGTASRANVSLEMLGETMKYLGGSEDLDLTMEQAAAMAGLMGNIGIQGSMAGTAMRAMANRLTKPAKEGREAMEALGLQVSDTSGNMRAMPDILRDLNNATRDLGNVERRAMLSAIFGAEAGSGMTELVNGMSDGMLDELINALQNNAGENARMAEVQADNLGGDLKNLRSAWEEVGISITDTNDGPLRDLVQNITEITRGVGDWIKANPELSGTIAKVVAAIIALSVGLGGLTMTFASILSPLLFARFAITTLGIKVGGLGTALGWIAKTAIPWVVGALKGLLVAMGPIGWGIAAIAGAAFLIYKYWEPIKAFFVGLWQQVKAAFDEGVGGVATLLVNWSPFGLIYNALISAVERLGISVPDEFSNFGSMIIDGIIGGIADKIGELRDYVTNLAGDIAGWMSDTVGNATDVGRDIANGLGDGIANATGRVRGAIRWMTGSAEEEARESLDTHSPSRVFQSIGIDVAKGLANGIEGDADGPLKQVRTLANNLRNAAGGLILGAGLSTGAAANVDTDSIQIDARPPLQSHTSGSAGSVTINLGGITVNAAPGMDEQALARMVGEQVQRALREAERNAAAASRRNFHDND